jgi:8-oxo-dGTP pyrophosphatase MutT (NUDIX family)
VLADYEPADEREAADLERVRALLASGADPWARATVPLHLTASIIVVDPVRRRVLLRWHDKQQQWLQAGGHAEPGERDAWAIAIREAAEETGLTDLRPWPGPEPWLAQVAVVSVKAALDEPAHEHADLQFVAATDRPDDAPAEREGVPLRWATLPDSLELADEWLARLLRRVGTKL